MPRLRFRLGRLGSKRTGVFFLGIVTLAPSNCLVKVGVPSLFHYCLTDLFGSPRFFSLLLFFSRHSQGIGNYSYSQYGFCLQSLPTVTENDSEK